jgi:predicted ATP-grasp superfamily ATP-dependent carboligase
VSVYIFCSEKHIGELMSEIGYYKGVHKVKVLTKSEGYWIIEALEDFEDEVECEKVKVKVGEQRIVPSEEVYKMKYLPPEVKEHVYELQMERKLKRLISKEEKQGKEE